MLLVSTPTNAPTKREVGLEECVVWSSQQARGREGGVGSGEAGGQVHDDGSTCCVWRLIGPMTQPAMIRYRRAPLDSPPLQDAVQSKCLGKYKCALSGPAFAFPFVHCLLYVISILTIYLSASGYSPVGNDSSD